MRTRLPTPLARTRTSRTQAGPALLDLADSYRLRLRATRKSPQTIRSYISVLHTLTDFLTEHGLSCDITRIGPGHIETFMADQLERLTPGTASARYGWLHVFFRWCVEVGELEADPMAHMHKPPTPDTPPPIPSVEDLKRLLHTCAGRGNDAQEAYHNRRDLAIFYLLLDTGMRRSEVCRLTWDDVDMTSGRVTIIGKRANGQDRTRYGRLGMASLSALDAYKRYRRGHKYASLPNIFLAQRGALTGQGVYDIVRRRAEQAGLDLRPHRFRHYFAHAWLAAGGSEGGLRALGGWRSDVMRRYGASLASERALSEHERLAPGDRL